MSLASWKKEFYKTKANKVSKRFALRHSLRKWIGLLSKNRKKHRVSLRNGTLYDDNNNTLEIDAKSCALCFHHPTHCAECPVATIIRDTACPCGVAFFEMRDNNRVLPMVKLLKKTLEEGK